MASLETLEHKAYPDYKVNRDLPDLLAHQVRRVKLSLSHSQ